METLRITPDELEKIGTAIFDAVGSPHSESKAVSEILVSSNLAGHDSHGVIRIPDYANSVREGALKPGAPFEIIHETSALAVVDAHHGWGMVSAKKAMQLAMAKARETGVGTVVVRNGMHIGRLGEYSTMAAEAGMIGEVMVNSYGRPDRVAPWGGIESRLSANPISWAAPTGNEWPFMVDITTCVVPEGKVRVAFQSGKKLPEGCLIDSEGKPTTDPAALYNVPPGAILPFGGIVGHKGYGINLAVEFIAGALSGAGWRGDGSELNGNGVFMQALDIGRFIPLERFVHSVRTVIAHVKSSKRAPGVDEILAPGEVEFRTHQQRLKEGIPVSEGIWQAIVSKGRELGVDVKPGGMGGSRS